MYKVRFHLSKGKFYKCWQVTSPNGDKDYYDPETHNLFMWGCKLRNQRKTAEKIHSGEHKTVCAWVECDMVDVHYKKNPSFKEVDTKNLRKYKYNPKKNLHWFTSKQSNVDDKELVKMHTNSRALYGRVN